MIILSSILKRLKSNFLNILCYQARRLADRSVKALLMASACFFKRKSDLTDGSVVLIFFGGLGDFIIWLSAARELRQIYHGRQITLCCPEAFAKLADATSYFDLIVTDKANGVNDSSSFTSSLSAQWRLRRNFMNIECDTLLQCFFVEDHIAAAVKARRRLCVSRYSRNLISSLFSKLIYDEILPFDQYNEHFLCQQVRYLKKLGWDGILRLQDLPQTKAATQFKEKYFVVFPGSSDPSRRWSPEKFSQAIIIAAQKYHLSCYVCGSPSEKPLAAKIIKLVQGRCNVADKTGETDVTELVELIRGAQFVLTNDTSAVHIAVGTQTPAVCIYGLWDSHKQVLPYPHTAEKRPLPVLCFVQQTCNGCDLNYTAECLDCIRKTGRRLCIEAVNVEPVIKAIETDRLSQTDLS